MATTVLQSFDEFLRDYVRIDLGENDMAKASKDELLKQIIKLPDDGIFPELHKETPFIQYGSYSRKTKIRPLDDIDIMVVLHAHGAWYDMYKNPTFANNQDNAERLRQFADADGNINSTKVINAFIRNLSKVHLYRKADFKKNYEAAVLELQSYDWVFDIVPCFITSMEPSGKTFFLIPDGKGGWKKTDPRVDHERANRVKKLHNFDILDVIRLAKYWNVRPTMPAMTSYLLENMLLDFFEGGQPSFVPNTVRGVFVAALNYIRSAVRNSVLDPKGLQGNLNDLNYEERNKISRRAETDYNRGYQALLFEANGQHQLAIEYWRLIFGNDFPSYPGVV